MTVGTVPDLLRSGELADGVTAEDAVYTASAFVRPVVDSAPLLDVVSRALSGVRSMSDAIGATDVVTASLNAGGTGLFVGDGALPIGTASYPIPTNGTARFVSPTGSNSNNGLTEATPWATFEHAAANTPAGGTIVMREGVYHEGKVFAGSANSNTSGYVAIPLSQNNITLQNYPGEEVWFDGSSVMAGWVADGSDWRIAWTPLRRDLYGWASTYPPAAWDDLDNAEAFWTYVDYSNTTRACAGRPERVWRRVKGSTDEADWVQLTQVANRADMTADTFFGDASANRLYIRANPATYDIRVTDKQTLLNGLGVNFTMRGIGVRRYAPSMPQFGCVKAHRAGATIEHCVFEDISSKGISLVAPGGVVNWLVSHCTFVRMGNQAINFAGTGVTIEDCRFEYCNDKLFNPAPDAGAWKGVGCRDVLIQRNLMYRTQRGKGGWFDVDCRELTVVNNDYIECEERGQVYELARDIIDANNRHVGGDAEGVVLMDCENAEIWNDTFYDLGGNRGQVMGADKINCTGISVLTDNRVGANGSGQSRFSYHNAEQLATWPTVQADRYIMQNIKVRNCIFGPSNYWAYFQYQYLGTVPSDGGSSPLRSYVGRADLDRNYYNGHSSKQTLSRTYPWVLQTGTGATVSNRIGSSLANLRSQSATDGDQQETNGVEHTDADRLTADGYLASSYQAAGNAMAEPIPATIAALIGVTTGTQLMGPRVRS